MKILVVGSGGREHALAWRLAQDERVEVVYVAPGNAGTALSEKLENVAENDLEKLSFSTKNIKNLYPYVRKNRLLLPVAYLHHCCFIVRRGFVKLFTKKPTETAPLHENAQKRKPLFDKLGLK